MWWKGSIMTHPYIPITKSFQLQYPFPFGLFPLAFSYAWKSHCLHHILHPFSEAVLSWLVAAQSPDSSLVSSRWKQSHRNIHTTSGKNNNTPPLYIYHTWHETQKHNMGRQNKDRAVVGSSIVLLQERFKHLQRLKEMREERELLKSTHHSYSYSYDEATKVGLSPLLLGLDSSPRYHRAVEPQHLPEKHDVDTSLRL